MDRLAVKHLLLNRGMTLFDLAVACGIRYDRIVKIVNGYRAPRPEEIDLISRTLSVPSEQVRVSRRGRARTEEPSGRRGRRDPMLGSRGSQSPSAARRSKHRLIDDGPRR
jgi:transcriptional regulator with XRE-family HTH domain